MLRSRSTSKQIGFLCVVRCACWTKLADGNSWNGSRKRNDTAARVLRLYMSQFRDRPADHEVGIPLGAAVCSLLYPPDQGQNYDDDQNKSDTTAGVIAPASRIRPSRQGADQEQYENNDQYGSDHDDFLKPTQTRQENAVYGLRFQQFANMLNCRSPVLLIRLDRM